MTRSHSVGYLPRARCAGAAVGTTLPIRRTKAAMLVTAESGRAFTEGHACLRGGGAHLWHGGRGGDRLRPARRPRQFAYEEDPVALRKAHRFIRQAEAFLTAVQKGHMMASVTWGAAGREDRLPGFIDFAAQQQAQGVELPSRGDSAGEEAHPRCRSGFAVYSIGNSEAGPRRALSGQGNARSCGRGERTGGRYVFSGNAKEGYSLI